MATMTTVEFKVAMDKEQAELKNHLEYSFEVDMSKAERSVLEGYALKSWKIELQGQIRSNWKEFEKMWDDDKLPTTLEFGSPLFGRKEKVRPPTEEEVKAAMAAKVAQMQAEGKSVEEIMAYIMTPLVK
jgi:hypothetical protein